MDPEFWRWLPEALLEKVFTRLPHQVISLRCLSKRWKILLSCKRFSDQTPPALPSHKPFFLRAVKGFNDGLLGYNPTLEQWRCLPLTSLSRGFKIRCLVASAGGLVCLYGKDVRTRSDGLIVCNPITEASRLLPPMPRNPFTAAGFFFVKVMAFDERSKSYKLFLADMGGDGDGPGCVVAQLYDSVTDRWSVVGDGPTGFMMLSQGVFVNGVIYFMGTRWVTTPRFSSYAQSIAHIQSGEQHIW
ncbi:hypothetical protein O6H91_01G053300 [Diphasiastrum complanatum]|uniref:Uncharacterized protein n=1 Tax=Diphasiastrum complanatum TaxID=34168 RepID=A0ACC2ERD0_DIPCM|nr:hypothetical protein O6H91_01G053300 [Diphasiastrum complanatum]